VNNGKQVGFTSSRKTDRWKREAVAVVAVVVRWSKAQRRPRNRRTSDVTTLSTHTDNSATTAAHQPLTFNRLISQQLL